MKMRWFAALILFVGLMIFGVSAMAATTPLDYEPARSAMQQKNWEVANYEWRHILDADPDNFEAKLGLAESLFNTGFYPEAISLLESIPLNRRNWLSQIALARTYVKTQEFSKSKDAYLYLLSQMPFQADAIRELTGLQARLTPEERPAVRAKLDTIAKVARVRGESAIKAAKYLEAANFYDIVSFHDNTVGLFNDYGIVLLLAGQYPKAHDQFILLKRKGKLGFAEVTSNAAMASLSTANYVEAKSEIVDAINAAGKNKRLKAKLYNNMGYILEMASKRSDAAFAYQHALELDPTLTTAQLNLAYVQQANRDYPQAIASYQKALKLSPNNAEIWNRLGFAYELRYETRPALAAYQRAIAINPKYRDSYYNLATLYKKTGHIKQANETLRKVAELAFAEMEAPKNAPLTANGDMAGKNPLKYVVLFPSDPKVLGGI